MKTFKSFIIEVIRTPKRAAKLVDNLAKRQKRYGFIPSPVSIYGKQTMKTILASRPFERTPEDIHDYGDSSNKYSHDVPLHKIYTIQDEISKSGTKSKMNDNTEPLLYYNPHRDMYSIIDGNHRISSDKLLGKMNIKSTVVYPLNHPGPKNENI